MIRQIEPIVPIRSVLMEASLSIHAMIVVIIAHSHNKTSPAHPIAIIMTTVKHDAGRDLHLDGVATPSAQMFMLPLPTIRMTVVIAVAAVALHLQRLRLNS
jgi:hypothetical protein